MPLNAEKGAEYQHLYIDDIKLFVMSLHYYQPEDECRKPPFAVASISAAIQFLSSAGINMFSGLLRSFLFLFDCGKSRIAILRSLNGRYIYHSRSALPPLSPAYQSGSFKLCNNTAGFSCVAVQNTTHIAYGKEDEQLAVLIMPAVHSGQP